MPAVVTTALKWNPANLDRAILSAFVPSLRVTVRDAQIHSPSPLKGGAKLTQVSASDVSTARGTIVPTGLGFVFEQGGKPHVIAPGASKVERTSFSRSKGATTRIRSKRGGKPFLYLKGPGVFVSGPVQHPGSPAQPYVKPAAARWAQGGFQAFARRSLATKGFR